VAVDRRTISDVVTEAVTTWLAQRDSARRTKR